MKNFDEAYKRLWQESEVVTADGTQYIFSHASPDTICEVIDSASSWDILDETDDLGCTLLQALRHYSGIEYDESVSLEENFERAFATLEYSIDAMEEPAPEPPRWTTAREIRTIDTGIDAGYYPWCMIKGVGLTVGEVKQALSVFCYTPFVDQYFANDYDSDEFNDPWAGVHDGYTVLFEDRQPTDEDMTTIIE